MSRSRLAVLVVLCVLLLVPVVSFASTSAAQEASEGVVVGRPQLTLFAPDNRVTGGGEIALEVFVTNNGQITRGGPAQYEERVKTARNVQISVRTDDLPEDLADNVEVLTGTVPGGTIPEGTAGPFVVRLEFDDDTPPGRYDLPLTLEYDYTRNVRYSDFREPVYADSSETDRVSLPIVVRNRSRFAVNTSGGVINAGDTATRSFTVENVGTQAATDASLVLASQEGQLYFGGPDARTATTSVALGRLDAGESTTVSVDVGAPATLSPGSYPITASIDYRTAAGVREQSTELTLQTPVGAEQTFGVGNVTETLQVGETGVINGTVVNTGDTTVSNAVVVFPGNASDLRPRASEYAVGTLAPGNSSTFSFTVDVANETTAGPRVLPVQVRYRNADDDVRVAPAVDVPVTIDGEQTFSLRDVAGDLQVDSNGTISGTVVNTGNGTVENATVVFAGSGAGITARETQFPVGTLGPGDAAEFDFPVGVPASTETGPQFVSFRVRYRGGGGERRLSDPIDATVRVGEEQSFEVVDVDSTLQVGERGTVSGSIRNTGNRTVTDAVVVLGTEGTTLQPRETEVAVGTLNPGDAADFSFSADVPATADAGSRLLLLRVRYRDGGDERTSDPIDARVDVAARQSFEIENVTSDLQVGERGPVSATLRNTGSATVEDATLVYTANGTLQPLTPTSSVGTLAPNETGSVAYTFDVPRTSDPGTRSLPFQVRYRGSDGELRTSAPLSIRTDVTAEQTFALRNVTSTLRVDDTGTVSATLVNTGRLNATGVAVVVQDSGPTLVARETEVAVGSLAANGSRPVRFRFDVTADAEPGQRLVTFRVRYRGGDGEIRETDDIDANVRVAPSREEFEVTPVNATVPTGDTEVVTIRVRNRENETLSDVRARLFVDDPLTSDDSEAFVPELAPNETVTLAFEVGAGGDALAKTYPLLVDFTYENERGESVLSDTYFVPVEVVEPAGRGLPSVPVLAVPLLGLALVLVAVTYWKRRTVSRRVREFVRGGS
jgi:hypothetical protein